MISIWKSAAAVAVVGTLALASATPGEARNGRWAAAGAGFAAGALVGAAAANAAAPAYYGSRSYAYEPGYAYSAPSYGAGYRAYAASGPAYAPVYAPRFQTDGCVSDGGYGRPDYGACQGGGE